MNNQHSSTSGVQPYRAGWIHFTNVPPILEPLVLPAGVTAITGVPTEMNATLPDFSVAVLGPGCSVNLFHTAPLADLKRAALTSQSAMSVVRLKGEPFGPVSSVSCLKEMAA